MRAHLTADAAAPLTIAEIASLGHRQSDDADECLMPVPADAVPLPAFKKSGRVADHRFDYRDAAGELLGHVLRWDARDGARKEFSPVTFWRNAAGKSAWRLKAWPNPRPLYGLDRLAKTPDAVVLLIEGEKAADSIERGPLAHAFTWAKRQVVGISWPGGAEAVGRADFSPLAGREVILLPDNDPPGEKAADQLIEIMHKVGVRHLRRWKAPINVPEGWDIADPLPDWLEPEIIVKSILDAPENAAPRLVITKKEFLAGFVPPDYFVDGILQRGFLYALTGATGSGKTSIALLLAALTSHPNGGQKLGPHDIERGRVVYIARENPTDIRQRMIGMAAVLGFDANPSDYLVIHQPFDILDRDLPRITQEIEKFGEVALVVVDTSAAVFPGDGDENDNPQMGAHARRLRKLCDLSGRPTVLALCHPVKRPADREDIIPRGGGAFIAEIDGNLTAWPHDDKLVDVHWTGKFRGPDFEPITFQLTQVNTTKLTDSKGRLMPTVMAKIVTAAQVEETEEKAAFQEKRLLTAMAAKPEGSFAQWAIECEWFPSGNPEQPYKSLVNRVMERLKAAKLVTKEGRTFTLTKAGKKAAKITAPTP